MINEVYADGNGNGTIEFPEFLSLIPDIFYPIEKEEGNGRGTDRSLKGVHCDRNELISATELRHTMRNFGGEADGRGSGRDDREADIDRDVHTNYEEYERMIMI